MIKERYTMQIEIEFEFDEDNITLIDATDAIDYFATADVKLDNENINILGANLTTN